MAALKVKANRRVQRSVVSTSSTTRFRQAQPPGFDKLNHQDATSPGQNKRPKIYQVETGCCVPA